MDIKDKRGLTVGLIVGLIASAGVAASSGTPAIAFTLSAVTVVLILVLLGLVVGLSRH